MAVTKRRISLPERHLRDTATSSRRILERWPAFAGACAASTPSSLRASSGGGRSSDVADPVLSIVLARARHDDMADKVYGLWHQARWLAMRHVGAHGASRTTPTGQLEATVIYAEALAERWDFVTADEDTAIAVHALLTEAYTIEDAMTEVLKSTSRPSAQLAARCSGEWRAGCSAISEPGRKGMCASCYYHDYRNDPRPITHFATESVIETASVVKCAPLHVAATCGRCGWSSPADSVDTAGALLEAHHAAGCQA